MAIGWGIFLLVVGAILAFAVRVDLRGIDVNLVGIILMLAGVAVIFLDQRVLARLRNARGGSETPPDPTAGRTIRRSMDDDRR